MLIFLEIIMKLLFKHFSSDLKPHRLRELHAKCQGKFLNVYRRVASG
jgi:hypothetical protein